MKQNTTEKAIEHFDRTAAEFDTIYTGSKNPLARKLDRWLRWDMQERLNRTMEVIHKYPGASVLDIGAGSGRFFAPAINAGASRIVAVEPAPQMVEIARQVSLDAGFADKVKIVGASFLEATNLPKCDVSIAIGLYDYIDEPLPYLIKTRELTTKSAVMTFPQDSGLRPKIRKFRLALRKCPVFFFSREKIEKLLKEAKFSNVKISRFGQLFFVVAKP